MLILYVLSVLSFVALAWAAIAITRHIRRNSALPPASSDAAVPEDTPRPASVPITLAGARRNPIAARGHSDWANLEKSIGNHDGGNTNYPRAARSRNPPPSKHSL